MDAERKQRLRADNSSFRALCFFFVRRAGVYDIVGETSLIDAVKGE
jgi:hypothetical protein